MLDATQQKAVDLACLGRSIFVTGSAGVGKTMTSRAIVSALTEKLRPSFPSRLIPPVAQTASTGVAAVMVGGSTIYSWAGIRLGNDSVDRVVRKLTAQARTAERSGRHDCPGYRVRYTPALLIDEVSRIPIRIFWYLHKVFCRVRGCNKPFGGIQLILVGDFFQLPPVKTNTYLCHICGNPGTVLNATDNVTSTLYKCSQGTDERCKTNRWDDKLRYCFEDDYNGDNLWNECGIEMVKLETIYRQSDTDFQAMLNRFRVAEHTPDDIDYLNLRCRRPLDESDGIKPTRLYPHNATVDAENTRNYMNLNPKDEEIVYKAATEVKVDGVPVRHGSPLLDMLVKSCPAKDVIALKRGAQVMLICNLNTKLGLVNGVRGVVVGFRGETQKNKKPLVKFFMEDASTKTYTISEHQWDREAGDECVSVRQIPLVYAWAITIDKSQGMTISKVDMNLSRVFSDGQAYVALSRAKSIKGLRVTGLTCRTVRASPIVKAFYKRPTTPSMADMFHRAKRLKVEQCQTCMGSLDDLGDGYMVCMTCIMK